MKFILNLILITTFILSTSSSATLITDTFDATVTSTANSSTLVTTTFVIQSTYDDQSQLMYSYLDSDNSILQTWNTASFGSNYDYFSDANISWGLAATNSGSSFDSYTYHLERSYLNSGGTQYMDQHLNDFSANLSVNINGIGSGTFYWFNYDADPQSDTFNLRQDERVSFSLVKRTNEVPEPSTLAIFALSMMGLVSRQLKKKP